MVDPAADPDDDPLIAAMSDLRPATTGTVVAGHGVASGRLADSPFAAGTIALQTPHLREHGIDLGGYHPATVNLDVAPDELVLLGPRWTAAQVAWTDVHGPETFSFVECRVARGDVVVDGLVYHPHPETKPAHHQPRTVVELLLPHLPDLRTGDRLDVAVAEEQAGFRARRT